MARTGQAQKENKGGAETDIVHVRRRQNRAVETRTKIIEAATAEFAGRGFDGATTRSIAHRAGLRNALVLYHFETKLGIWQAVMQDTLHCLHDAFEARLAGLQGVDEVTKLRLLQADFIRMAAKQPEIHWLMSHEAGAGGERLDWLVENLLGKNTELFKDLVVAAQRAGCYVAGDPYHLHYLFLGAAARIFMLASEVEKIMHRTPFDPAFVEEHIVLCQDLFFRQPKKP